MGYVASKFAVRGLTQALCKDHFSFSASLPMADMASLFLAVEMAPHKVTVNAYCPGLILTPMGEDASLTPRNDRTNPLALVIRHSESRNDITLCAGASACESDAMEIAAWSLFEINFSKGFRFS